MRTWKCLDLFGFRDINYALFCILFVSPMWLHSNGLQTALGETIIICSSYLLHKFSFLFGTIWQNRVLSEEYNLETKRIMLFIECYVTNLPGSLSKIYIFYSCGLAWSLCTCLQYQWSHKHGLLCDNKSQQTYILERISKEILFLQIHHFPFDHRCPWASMLHLIWMFAQLPTCQSHIADFCIDHISN